LRLKNLENHLGSLYIYLLSEYQPKLIKTEEENEQALAMVEKLMHLSNRTPEQQELYELLIVLIEKFEQEFYQPQSEPNPRSILAFLMEQRDMQPADLVNVFGSIAAGTDILTGKTQIDRSSVKLLGEIFHVDSIMFIRFSKGEATPTD
jgi:HTH-type transcriptional regulator / antitoxin HigA